jgi:hypothetical protein
MDRMFQGSEFDRHGQRVSILCKADHNLENSYSVRINEISVQCFFTKEVCSATKSINNVKGIWDEDTVEALEIWLEDQEVRSKAHQPLPCFILWVVWLTRNESPFLGADISPYKIFCKLK